jgi:hypothetical protein
MSREILDVDFDDCIGFANRPIKSTDGYIKGKLISMKPTQIIVKQKRTKKSFEDDTTQKVLKFIFLVDGSVEPIKMSKITGTNLSTDKVHVKAKGRGVNKESPEYNALTEMCLKLGIFKESELSDNNNELLDKVKEAMTTITESNPIYIKAKLEIGDNSDFENINMRTIELIEKY